MPETGYPGLLKERSIKMKIAVIFPGIGYHTDKPLLYYSKKAAAVSGYEILNVTYSGLPQVKMNERESMNAAFEKAYAQASEQLGSVDLSAYEEVLFIEKSLGTLVGFRYCKDNGMRNVKHICFTPVPDTFKFIEGGSGVIFHGLNDPWCQSSTVCEEYKKINNDYRLITFENANHSLETGNVVEDIGIVKKVTELLETVSGCARQ